MKKEVPDWSDLPSAVLTGAKGVSSGRALTDHFSRHYGLDPEILAELLGESRIVPLEFWRGSLRKCLRCNYNVVRYWLTFGGVGVRMSRPLRWYFQYQMGRAVIQNSPPAPQDLEKAEFSAVGAPEPYDFGNRLRDAVGKGLFERNEDFELEYHTLVYYAGALNVHFNCAMLESTLAIPEQATYIILSSENDQDVIGALTPEGWRTYIQTGPWNPNHERYAHWDTMQDADWDH